MFTRTQKAIGLNPRIKIHHDLISTKILPPADEVFEPHIIGRWNSAPGSFYYRLNPVLVVIPGHPQLASTGILCSYPSTKGIDTV